jgi:hypothetical protein
MDILLLLLILGLIFAGVANLVLDATTRRVFGGLTLLTAVLILVVHFSSVH